jgi:hypothetical protein
MNISVPDALAEEVRRREVPISAICQRALRSEVDRLRNTADVDDIQVYDASAHDDCHPSTAPGYDPDRPYLVYGRHPAFGMGWTFWHKVDGELTNHFIGRAGSDGFNDAAAVWDSVRHTFRPGDPNRLTKIAVEVGEPAVTVGFTGRWLLEPDENETRSKDPGYDPGEYWGIALTKRGRIAVYGANVGVAGSAILRDYDSLGQASELVPNDLIARAAAELDKTRVIWRDI